MTQPTSIKMPDDLHAALKKIAAEDGRSMSNLIVYVLRQYVKQKEEN